jgi:hypothetical protein
LRSSSKCFYGSFEGKPGKLEYLNPRSVEGSGDFARPFRKIDPFNISSGLARENLLSSFLTKTQTTPDMKLSLLPSLVAFWATGALVFGQSTVKPAADPFASSASQPVSEPTGVPNGPDIMVRLEVFSMSPAAARGALKKFPKQTDLYAWIDTELSKPNSAISLEKVSLLRMPSGYRTKIELIAEYPYPG